MDDKVRADHAAIKGLEAMCESLGIAQTPLTTEFVTGESYETLIHAAILAVTRIIARHPNAESLAKEVATYLPIAVEAYKKGFCLTSRGN